MATLISDALIHDDSVIITDMDIGVNEHDASTLDLSKNKPTGHSGNKHKADQLTITDGLFGPLQMGSISITRVSLDALGATLGGQPLSGQNTFFRTPRRSFINALQFNANKVDKQIRTASAPDSYLLTTLLFELASRRPLTSPPILWSSDETQADPGQYRRKLSKLLTSAHKLDLRHAHLPDNNPRWVGVLKSNATLGSSVGIQGFGIFMGLRGVVDAIKSNNSAEIVINTAGIASEFGSIAADVAVNKVASEMITAGQTAYKDFAKTRFAVRLGRSGGLIGGALTLPFDIYTAIRSLNAADNAAGKEALDHYVSAGLSITSAAMTVILGGAAMAGFSFAGPVGLAAGAILAIGSQVYGAVRIVDDIDDYIELTTEERWRTGWFSFCFMNPDQDVQNRYSVAKARTEHLKQLKATARKLLDGELQDDTEAVVNGTFEVHLTPKQVWTRNWWTKRDGWETVNVPQIKGGDDTIDARAGVTASTPGAELGKAAENKGILWLIGDGRDSIVGVEKKTNTFHYKSGKKHLTGGEKDDRFVFEGAADLLRHGGSVLDASTLQGGAGSDTLVLGGANYSASTKGSGYDVNLPAGTLHTTVADPTVAGEKKRALHSRLDSVENIETVTNGQSIVTGTEQRNIIKSRGRDTIKAGAGNDQIHLLHGGASASGEAGVDEYFIAHQAGRISITEDGDQESVVVLNWRMDLIESWVIENTALIITSRFDFQDSPKSVVAVQDVYTRNDTESVLKNNKLTFMTRDGFVLMPDFPETLENGRTVELEIIVVKQGQAEKPIILYTPTYSIRHQQDAGYYLPRSPQDTAFEFVERRDAVTRIYLDYASDELKQADAHFTARKSDKDHDLMAGCDLQYLVGEKKLTLRHFAFARGGTDPMNMTKILRTMAAKPLQRIVLIFNDGVAFNAKLTAETDVAPADNHYEMHALKHWTTRMNLPMPLRTGRFTFDLPENEAYRLGTRRACAKLASLPAQTAMESLEGQGSTYLVHLVADMTIKLSTPGALANAAIRLPYSSTWELDATALGAVAIKLENNKLHIGTCTIHLPVYDSEDLIDQIRVITTEGLVHTVDLSFDRVYPDGLDGRFFKAPTPSKDPLPPPFTALADKVLNVRNIVVADNRPGILSYSFPERSWRLDVETLCIDHSQLNVINRCSHQLPQRVMPASLLDVAEPPLSRPAQDRSCTHSESGFAH